MRHAFVPPAPWSAVGAIGALLAAVLAQAALWSPQGLWRGVRGMRSLPRADQAALAGFTALVLVSAVVRGIPPEPNWWGPAALVLIVAVAVGADEMGSRSRRALLATILVPTAVACAHTLHPFLPLPPAADPTARLHGWKHPRASIEAAGVGAYGPAAERCVYQDECDEIHRYFNEMHTDAEGRF
jgi:hypothetical protein